ncbi:hypothetical protein GGR52DRAFT_571608 [Hypoxylon sp. FL1284]|nr:hypothetical protein GGR52DRAFT_571608 [Hypoxylon sp. FL1284]
MEQLSLEEILSRPGLPPPDGIVPDFDNRPNRNAMSLAVVGVFTGLVVVAFFFRATSTIFYIRKLYVDDVLCFLAFGTYIVSIWSAFTIIITTGSLIHQWNLHVRDVNVNTFDTVYGLNMLFAKPAVLLEWIRIFVPRPTRNAFFVTCWILIVINCRFYIAGILAVNFGCHPREKSWYTWLPGTCVDRKRMDIVSSYINLASDIAILLLPQRVIWSLNMSPKRRIGISVIFSMGVLACVSVVGRIYATATLDYQGDVTYGTSPALLWGLTETTCVLLVLCFPSVPRILNENVLRKFALSVRSWTQFPLSLWRRAKDSTNASLNPSPFAFVWKTRCE